MNIDSLIKFFNKAIAPLKRKVQLMIGRSVLTAISDSPNIQLCNVNLLADETKDQVEVFNHFGFSSNPPPGSEGIMLSIGGNREHGVIVAHEHRDHRYKDLPSGDSILYNKNGKYIWIKGNDIEMLLSKIKIENDSHEAITVISDFMDKVINGYVFTAIGPQQWMPDTKALLQAEKDKFDTFKV